MKGIILAGGTATRLYPTTRAVSKHLLPIYDKPMVYYPLSVLMLSGIQDVLIISTKRDIEQYRALLGDGNGIGMKFSYKSQSEPKGLADAFNVGREYIGSDRVALVLGDNIFYGQGLSEILNRATKIENGAVIFGYYVSDPRSFGVVEFDSNGKVISLEEKPNKPKSHYAVPGLYFYDNQVLEIVKKLQPSDRGELEITDVNKMYLQRGELKVQPFGRGLAWFDAGTPEGLLEASSFVQAIQKQQGLQIACIEEIAYRLGYIDNTQLRNLAEGFTGNEYGSYLLEIANEDNM